MNPYIAATFVFTVFLCFGMHVNESKNMREKLNSCQQTNQETLAQQEFYNRPYVVVGGPDVVYSEWTPETEGE